MRKILLMIITAIMMVFFTACANEVSTASEKDIVMGHVDYPWYDSIDSLYGKADLVVMGKILGSRVELISHMTEQNNGDGSDQKIDPGGKNDNKALTTIYTLEISTVYKGSPDKTIEILQLGGETDTAIYIYEGTPQININEEYIMFLHKSTIDENAAWLLNNVQAIYKVEGKDLIKLDQNTLELTYKDLKMLEMNY